MLNPVRVFARCGSATPLTSTSDLDPAVDRVIQRCLAAKPQDRPASALAVAAGLPGADPLAAALAAGETPSPEMIAEAGGEGRLRPAVGVALLLVAIVGALGYAAMHARFSLLAWVPFDVPPAVLDARAAEIMVELGYTDQPVDTASGFELTGALAFLDWLDESGESPDRWEVLRQGRPPVVGFWWRSSPQAMNPDSPNPEPPRVSFSEPSHERPGMVRLRLGIHGDLVMLDVVPMQRGSESAAVVTPDWARAFALAGLDIDAFAEAEPSFNPPMFADVRMAWEGPSPPGTDEILRIEAAALEGRLVSWRAFAPWAPLPSAESVQARQVTATETVILSLFGTMLFATILGGIFVARRNARLGRGDRRAAGRLGLVVAVATSLSWIATGVGDLLPSFAWGAAVGGLAWSFYMVVEPVMRRRGPETMIGWTRLLSGAPADPLVGRDLLVGCAAGASYNFADQRLLALLPGGRPFYMSSWGWQSLGREFAVVGSLLENLSTDILLVFGAFTLILSATVVLRRAWVGIAVLGLLVGGLVTVADNRAGAWAPLVVVVVVFLTLGFFLRFGLLSGVVAILTSDLLSRFAVTLDFSVWYSTHVLLAFAAFFGLAAYGFYISVDWQAGLSGLLDDRPSGAPKP